MIITKKKAETLERIKTVFEEELKKKPEIRIMKMTRAFAIAVVKELNGVLYKE